MTQQLAEARAEHAGAVAAERGRVEASLDEERQMCARRIESIQKMAAEEGERWAAEMAAARARDAALREEHLDSMAGTIKLLRSELDSRNESFTT